MTTVAPEPDSTPAASVTTRLVPTLIGRSMDPNPITVWIECPSWCKFDHATDRNVAVEDVWHSSEFVDLEMPHREGTELLAYFRLTLDPYSNDPTKRRPFISGEDGFTANGRHMNPEHIESMCDKVEASIVKLRSMARACRTMNEAVVS